MSKTFAESGYLSGMKAIERYMGCSHMTIRRWVKRHSFPARKVGTTWFLDKNLVPAWIDKYNECREPGAGPQAGPFKEP
jgi:excisionase family DNA binding protein